MFVENAYAMAAPPGAEVTTLDTVMSFFPLVVLLAIFYFFLFRPQQKKQKELRNMLENLKEGDNVLTQGGLYGTIAKIRDNEVTLTVAEGVKVKVNRAYIVGPKTAEGEPAK